MGYSVRLVRGKSRSKIGKATLGELPQGSNIRLAPESDPVGDNDLWFTVTYNYSWYFSRALGRKGLEAINGLRGKDAIPVLEAAVGKLSKMEAHEQKTGRVLTESFGAGKEYNEAGVGYWDSCARNSKKAIEGILWMARLAPFFTFEVA